MDHTPKSEAETVFATSYPTKPPTDYSNAFRPANDDHLLIQPKKLPNPVLESRNHRVMQQELKLNNKLGIDVLNQKSELSKVFQERQREHLQEQTKKSPMKSEFELILERRKKEAEEVELKETEEQERPEFVKMKEKLRKA
ncbi:protein FAM107B-like [Clavelina lepadiformis]|uniref:Protein FAM107B n=1 Tax=Clavelina lepadiformis TaxID=159417 RepID=A0ABP0GGZ5_CLALP